MAVPTGMAMKKKESHRPRTARGALSSMNTGTTVWKEASPTPDSMRPRPSTQ
jgi:hypothetical protein